MGEVVLRAPTADDMRAIGEILAAALLPGDTLVLAGDLGAGKTTLVQGIAKGLGFAGHVASPTFTLVREYAGRLLLRHVDVYRLERVQDVLDLGLEDDPDAVVAVEWGDAVEASLPPDHLTVEIAVGDGEERRLVLRAPDGPWDARLATLRETMAAWRAA
ncbi:MAG: tRNA (adenosine(37)-N6)-threonylcarbamoyltransferase complex ATPase subunit type 1 TsaE [Actinomycetota bacterium]